MHCLVHVEDSLNVSFYGPMGIQKINPMGEPQMGDKLCSKGRNAFDSHCTMSHLAKSSIRFSCWMHSFRRTAACSASEAFTGIDKKNSADHGLLKRWSPKCA